MDTIQPTYCILSFIKQILQVTKRQYETERGNMKHQERGERRKALALDCGVAECKYVELGKILNSEF